MNLIIRQIKIIGVIMLKNNKELITFKDIFCRLSENNQKVFKELFDEARTNCKNERVKKFFEDSQIVENEFKINDLDKDIYYYLGFYIKLYKENNNFKSYCEEILKIDLISIKNNNSIFPFLYILILLKHYSFEKLESFINNSEIDSSILKLLDGYKMPNIKKNIDQYILLKASKKINKNTVVFNLYLDETGNINAYKKEKERIFAIGGYFTKDKDLSDWYQESYNKLDELNNEYFKNDDRYYCKNDKQFVLMKVYHRNIIDQNLKKEITEKAFNFLNENNAKFVCIYEEDPNYIEFTRKYYVDLVSILIVRTLNKIIKDKEYNIDLSNQNILLIIKMPTRIYVDKYQLNSNSNRNMEPIDIEPDIKEGIETLKLKYGLDNNNINYVILPLRPADKESDLVFADYFCNLFYRHNDIYYKTNKLKYPDDKIIYDNFKNMIYKEIEYSSFDKDSIDFYFDKYDYYTILNRYILYKKILSSKKIGNKVLKKYSQNDIDNILEFFKDKYLYKRVNYLVHAVKSILDNLEIESNNKFKYDNILESCNILIDLLETIKNNHSKNSFVCRKIDSMIFMINTSKLAVYNHSDNTEKSLEIIELNKNNIKNIDNDYFFLSEKILFDNISTVAQWDFYECDYIIKYIKKVLEDLESYDKLYIDDIARLYGTLGQTYIIHYYATEDTKDLDKAKYCFDKSKELFKDDNLNIKRVYSNLMLYAITAGREDEFLDYLYKYITEKEESFDNIDLLIEKLVSYIDNNNQPDKSDKYLIIRLLRYCKNFNTEYSRRISNILIEKSSNFYDDKKRKESTEDVDIEKDYCFVYYKIKKEKISLSNSYIFVENLKGYFQYMRKLSLYLTEILTGDESYFDKAVDILEEMVNMQDTNYKKAFGKFFEESAKPNLDKYKWAYNLSKKLYM